MPAKFTNGAGRQIWIDALRSGDYKQATGQLARFDMFKGTTFCCLGVACELAVEHGVIDEFHPNGGDLSSYADVADWVGISRDCETDTPQDTVYIDINDTELLSFAEIADYIEAQA